MRITALAAFACTLLLAGPSRAGDPPPPPVMGIVDDGQNRLRARPADEVLEQVRHAPVRALVRAKLAYTECTNNGGEHLYFDIFPLGETRSNGVAHMGGHGYWYDREDAAIASAMQRFPWEDRGVTGPDAAGSWYVAALVLTPNPRPLTPPPKASCGVEVAGVNAQVTAVVPVTSRAEGEKILTGG